MNNGGAGAHASMQADIDTLQAVVTFGKILYGTADETELGSTEWNGSEGRSVQVTFASAFSSPPLVVATLKPGDYDTPGGSGNHSIYSPVGTYIHSVSTTDFVLLVRRDNLGGYARPNPIRFNWIALGS